MRRRPVKVGWFRTIDPHVVNVIIPGIEHLNLLVIPPDTAPAAAHKALAIATQCRDRVERRRRGGPGGGRRRRYPERADLNLELDLAVGHGAGLRLIRRLCDEVRLEGDAGSARLHLRLHRRADATA
ncbi:DUF5994 family protein [Nonomuraea polychroma]|uniref:DUF5994 family protein n=1 Tax=Nonomuraea polychroma TaxID=46176 RepID=UPI00240CFBB6|nr:DUF5994 family protein [Nonomuraea polychroma]